MSDDEILGLASESAHAAAASSLLLVAVVRALVKQGVVNPQRLAEDVLRETSLPHDAAPHLTTIYHALRDRLIEDLRELF